MVSVHLKATMMKISDPIMFGHFVSVFFKDAFAKHADAFAALGVNPNLGLGSLYEKLKALPDAEREAIEADLAKCYESRPKLAMVDSDKGITNLARRTSARALCPSSRRRPVPAAAERRRRPSPFRSPSPRRPQSADVIIDASMPNVIRDSGKWWNRRAARRRRRRAPPSSPAQPPPPGRPSRLHRSPRALGPGAGVHDPRPRVRPDVRGVRPGLQGARPVRRHDDGQRLERRADGAES